ncbi:MAG: glycogen synthase GlgA, partial [candidate division Zixibacteria bacterium]|nr:glycogen synthase GlgA [candidate division Zixibacteria bacterium]
LVASSEMVPFAKTGGLADVIGALPAAMAKQGSEVKTFIPLYDPAALKDHTVHSTGLDLKVSVNGTQKSFTVDYIKAKRLPLEYCFIDNGDYFKRLQLYRDERTGSDYTDNDMRFAFFARAVLEAVKGMGWKPDIIHVHDWQAAMIPVYLKTLYAEDPFFANVRTVLTIHNLAYQGTFDGERFEKLDLPEKLFFPTSPFEFYGKVNFLKAAIEHSDRITTVSERYAEEIQTDEHGCGLQGVLQRRTSDISGILNGVDYTIWSPSRDKKIPYNYYAANLSGKKMNKIELLGKAGLPVREKTPLVGIISRLADQKGFDLIAEIADEIFQMDLQMIVLGTGEEKYHQLFEELQQKFPDKLKVYLAFDDSLAHWIEAAADMFLMPSHYEPCGLNQMYSLKYGTVPLVREVGGLADTVDDYNPRTGEGTGFVFSEYTSQALREAIERAVSLYPRRRPWTKIMKAGMRQDFSWDKAAWKYLRLFEELIRD